MSGIELGQDTALQCARRLFVGTHAILFRTAVFAAQCGEPAISAVSIEACVTKKSVYLDLDFAPPGMKISMITADHETRYDDCSQEPRSSSTRSLWNIAGSSPYRRSCWDPKHRTH